MWQSIFVASATLFVIRVSPALFQNFNKVHAHAKIMRVLDYAICLVTGEMIYTIAFDEYVHHAVSMPNILLAALTLLFASMVMVYTSKITYSFLGSILFFIVFYHILI